MTAVTPLVEKVARALSQWMNAARLPTPPNWERLQEATRQAYRDQARAALDACHAEEMLEALNALASWDEGEVVSGKFDEPGSAACAREVLAKLDIKPTGQPV